MSQCFVSEYFTQIKYIINTEKFEKLDVTQVYTCHPPEQHLTFNHSHPGKKYNIKE